MMWPEISYARDRETFATLHLCSQVVGKVRLALTPWLNHSWHVPLYLSARGLTTSIIPHPENPFELEFDFVEHRLTLRTAAGLLTGFPLACGSIAAFYRGVTDALAGQNLAVRINGMPNEIPDAVPFAEDTATRRYDPDAAWRLWRALLSIDAVLKRFRTGFIGKASPVHFFWGSFDLAVTRFSGRPAPLHPGGIPRLPDAVAREAYSHEVSSAGFWPGGPMAPNAMFYSYAYPEPRGFREHAMISGARFDPVLQEFVLPYDAVRAAADPEQALLAFLQETYAAAADCAQWDRAALECALGKPRAVRPL